RSIKQLKTQIFFRFSFTNSLKNPDLTSTVQFKTNLYISFPRLFFNYSIGKGKVEEESDQEMSLTRSELLNSN
ncbi:hypothetical protein BpHYR1_033919, partial [Brachionus plicatilis]